MTTQADCESALVRIIPPLDVTDTILISNNVPENEQPLYDAAVSYQDSEYVIAAHRVYQNNSGATQTDQYPPDNPLVWTDLGASNAWKMFDSANNTTTTNAGTIEFEVSTGSIVNSVALLGLAGASVTVTMTDPDAGVVYNNTQQLRSSEGVVGLYSWLYRSASVKESIVLVDLPSYRAATVKVVINAGAGIARCAHVAMGWQQILGTLQYGYSLGILDFSTITEVENGAAYLSKGNYADEPEIDMRVDNARFDYVKRVLTRMRGTAAVYVCGQTHETMTVYGFYRSFRITVPHEGWAECTLTIRGLI